MCNSSQLESLKSLVVAITTQIVDTPSALRIFSEEKQDKILIIITTKPDELGQLIGEQGSIANSIRIILRAFCRKNNGKNVTFSVVPEIDCEF